MRDVHVRHGWRHGVRHPDGHLLVHVGLGLVVLFGVLALCLCLGSLLVGVLLALVGSWLVILP